MNEVAGWDTPLDEEPRRRRAPLEICRCGHAEARHLVGAGTAACFGGRNSCPCSRWLPVLLAADARDFMYAWKTVDDGGTEAHPLIMGVRREVTKGKSVTWLTEDRLPPECDAPDCGKQSVNARFIEGGGTVMVCGDHLTPRVVR